MTAYQLRNTVHGEEATTTLLVWFVYLRVLVEDTVCTQMFGHYCEHTATLLFLLPLNARS